ncbi:MAG: hypothetical protein FD131_3458 [Rhodocyclaceae bacterium]|nr:MAG: hypothetical protein FD131_3458 [Rhodocyclaceae bacterium]
MAQPCSDSFLASAAKWAAGAVLGARAEGDDAGRALDGQLGQGFLLVFHGRPDFWPKNEMAQRLARGFGQLGEAFDHERQGGLVERMADVDQAITRFAGEADALRNAGQPRDERRFERIGQDVDGVIAAGGEQSGQLPARLERQLAVAEGAVEHIADFRHALQDGRYPARGDGVELETGLFGVQAGKQRLRHDRVADPGGGDDEGFHGGGARRPRAGGDPE